MRDPVQNRDVLAKRLARIERQRRYVALRIDPREVNAAFGKLGLEVDLFMLKGQTGLVQGNVVG